MATYAQLKARIESEVEILSETQVGSGAEVNTYRIVHKRTRGVNTEGRTLMVWVYDEGGAGEQAIMSYIDWRDQPISNRYLDYLDTLTGSDRTRNEAYLSVDLMRFRQINSQTIEYTGVWEDTTDLLRVYESGPVPETPAYRPGPGHYAFGEGYRETGVSINPQDGKANAIKLPIFETAGLMQPQGNGFIDTVNHQIVMPEGYECFKVDFNLTIVATGATGGSGSNFLGQWQRNGAWTGKEYQSGYLKGDSLIINLSLNVMVQDEPTGISYFDFWMWTEGRQGTIDLRDVTCIATEIYYDPNWIA